MLMIRLHDGEELHFKKSARLEINPTSGVVTVHHNNDGREEIVTHYSPAAWQSVTHKAKRDYAPVTGAHDGSAGG